MKDVLEQEEEEKAIEMLGNSSNSLRHKFVLLGGGIQERFFSHRTTTSTIFGMKIEMMSYGSKMEKEIRIYIHFILESVSLFFQFFSLVSVDSTKPISLIIMIIIVEIDCTRWETRRVNEIENTGRS